MFYIAADRQANTMYLSFIASVDLAAPFIFKKRNDAWTDTGA